MEHNLQEVDIQPDNHVVFVHIAKTAGTSFNAILEPVVSGMFAYPDYEAEKLLLESLEELRKYQFFSGHFPYEFFSEILFPEGFIGLTFLREPVGRTLSTYKFIHELLKRDETPELSGYANEFDEIKKMTLLQLLERSDLAIHRHVTNTQTRFLGDMPPAFFEMLRRKYNLYLNKDNTDSTLIHLERAKKRLADIAFFGLTERFQDSLFLLSYTFGWRPTLNKVHLNATSGKGDKVKMDSHTLAAIQEKAALDFELYAFGQALFEKRFNEMTRILLGRYGTKEQSALELPLPNDVMMQLLEKHYIARRDRRFQQSSTSLAQVYEYSPAMPVEGSFGWYPLDDFPEYGLVRWSGPGLQSGFDLPCPLGENIQVSFCVLLAIQSNIMDRLSLNANNTPVSLMCECQSDGSYIFTGQIPHQAILGSFVRLTFSVPETIAPASIDPDNGDTRQLGILLNWVKLSALNQAQNNLLSAGFSENANTYTYSLSMPFDNPFGWYGLENSVNGPVRWSGPGLQSGFNLPCPPWKRIQISFRVLMVLHSTIIEALSLTINDLPVKLKCDRQHDGSYIFTGEIPADSLVGPFIRLIFSVPQTIAPSSLDPNNKDVRQLGILLNWVKLHNQDSLS